MTDTPTMQSGDSRSLERLAAHVRALPMSDQLELLRMIGPEIISKLDDEERAELVADINVAIEQRRAARAPR